MLIEVSFKKVPTILKGLDIKIPTSLTYRDFL